MTEDLSVFEDYKIRRIYDEEKEIWYFSVIDIIQILTEQEDYQKARKYWNKLKERLKEEGSELVTFCHQLKMPVSDGKLRNTDVAAAETLLRLIQSVPSPKAEPVKLWLAKVGYERMQEMADPELSLDRARDTWQKHGRSEKWIHQEWAGLSVKEHKDLKKLKTQNLRDHMSEAELIFTALAEGTVAKRTSSRLRRTNDRSVLGVHENHEDNENAEIGVRQQCPELSTRQIAETMEAKGMQN
ncbi:MAG: Bro-N domain-containing protein [bacterium]